MCFLFSSQAPLQAGGELILVAALVDVDVRVAQTAYREHHAVRVEGCACDGACLRGCQEGGVGVDGVDAGAVDVEEGEGVGVGAAVERVWG